THFGLRRTSKWSSSVAVRSVSRCFGAMAARRSSSVSHASRGQPVMRPSVGTVPSPMLPQKWPPTLSPCELLKRLENVVAAGRRRGVLVHAQRQQHALPERFLAHLPCRRKKNKQVDDVSMRRC